MKDGFRPAEIDINARFKPLRDVLVAVRSPRTIVDRFGRILAWILPEILPPRIQVCSRHGQIPIADTHTLQAQMLAATDVLGPSLAHNIEIHSGSSSWRYDPKYFADDQPDLLRGLLDFSPAWFMVGHVRCQSLLSPMFTDHSIE